jgi:hypothetical protein
MESEQLSRGKAFHRRVQAAWAGEIAGAPVLAEKIVRLVNAPDGTVRTGKGRIDILVGQVDDFVSVFEIKGSDWDRIKTANVRRNLAAHVRQALSYIDTYVEGEGANVCAAIIYPSAPRSHKLKIAIETYLNAQGFQVVWFDDLPDG